MKLLSDIIQEDVIDEMNLTLIVEEITGAVLTVCSTKWVRVGSVITDADSVEFTVTAFVKDSTVTVNAAGFVGNATIKKPVFLYGTPKQTNNEYALISSRSNDKLPLIWLLDGFRESGFGEQSSKERTVSCRLFFVDTFDYTWLNDDVKTNSLDPMYQLAAAFVQTITDNYSRFSEVSDFQYIPRTRFGVVSANGEDRRIIDDDLSGVELEISFDVWKVDSECCETEDPVLSCPSVRVHNTNDTYDVSVISGGTLELPDTDYRVFVNTVLKAEFSLPTLEP